MNIYYTKSPRQLAMEWWNNLTITKRIELTQWYYGERNHKSLTGFEIQNIHKKHSY